MKRTDKFFYFLKVLLLVSLSGLLLTGCGNSGYDMPYDVYSSNSAFSVVNSLKADKAVPFASDLCIVNEDMGQVSADLTNTGAAALFSCSDNTVLFSKNVHDKLHPASLTKIMTALVAIRHGNRDDVLTASEQVKVTEAGAQVIGLNAGDSMTLDQALHILLLYSANDVANLIAEHYGGTIEDFCTMMNDEAVAIGATGSHFSNPHGLTEADQYVTAYDMYLIFNEACKYELFREIIAQPSYSTIYKDASGTEKKFEKTSTVRFINGDAHTPAGITPLGGKTGTTDAAGHCLVMLSSDINGKNYISVVLRADSRDNVYSQTSSLLELAG